MRFWQTACAVLAAFLLGWFACQAGTGGGGGITGAVTAIPRDVASPSDHLSEGQVLVFDDRVIINISGASWARIADTNSMDPVLDSGANTLEMEPAGQESVNPGDIISYRHGSDVLVHRVVETGEDGLGWYCLVRGDNAKDQPVPVRFPEIEGIVVGILY